MFFQFLTYLFFKDQNKSKSIKPKANSNQSLDGFEKHVNHKTGTCYYTTIGAPIESNKKDQTGIVTYM